MKFQKYSSMIMMLTSIIVLSLVAFVAPVRADPPTLQQIFDTRYGAGVIHVVNDELPWVETFLPGKQRQVVLIYEDTAWLDVNELHAYYAGHPQGVNHYPKLIFAGSENAPPDIQKYVDFPTGFGLMLTDPFGHNWHTENAFNEDGNYDHAWVYMHPIYRQGYIIAFEDTENGGDHDHNDMVIELIPPLQAVGGIWVPINKFELLAPWIGLVSLISAMAVSVVYAKRRKKQQN